MSAIRRLGWHAGLLLAQVASVAAVGRLTPLDAGFPLDDAWIHQSAARNWVELGTLGLVPGQFGSGTTSLLWAALLAFNHALLHASPSVFSALTCITLLIVTGQAVLHCAYREKWGPTRSFVFALLLSVSPNFVWFAYSGMEVCLYTALLVLVVALWFAPKRSTSGSIGCGVGFALLFLTRPESIVLAGALLLMRTRDKQSLRHSLWAALPLSAVLSAYFGINHFWLHRLGPSTFMGRRWMWLQESADWTWAQPRADFIARWLDRIWQFTLDRPPLAVFWLLVGLALLGAVRTIGAGGRIGALVVAGAAQLATYIVVLPTEGHGGRYQPLVAALFLPLSAEGLHALLAARMRGLWHGVSLTDFARVMFSFALFPSVAGCLATWSSAQALAVHHVNKTEVALGHWVARLPEHARVASFDVGGLSYFGKRPVLDLGGLSDPAPLVAIQRGKIRETLEAARIDYLVVPMGYSDYFPDPWSFMWRLGILGSERPRMHRVAEFSSPPSVWVPGLLATLHCAPRQVVYRLGEKIEGAP